MLSRRLPVLTLQLSSMHSEQNKKKKKSNTHIFTVFSKWRNIEGLLQWTPALCYFMLVVLKWLRVASQTRFFLFSWTFLQKRKKQSYGNKKDTIYANLAKKISIQKILFNVIRTLFEYYNYIFLSEAASICSRLPWTCTRTEHKKPLRYKTDFHGVVLIMWLMSSVYKNEISWKIEMCTQRL